VLVPLSALADDVECSAPYAACYAAYPTVGCVSHAEERLEGLAPS
jgi:hypothetical protein